MALVGEARFVSDVGQALGAFAQALRGEAQTALQQGFVAVDFSRDGWYHLSKEER